MPCCSAINCHNRSGMHFYRVPKSTERRLQWLQNIGRHSLPNYAVLCEKHFTSDQFENRTDRKVLRRNAMPTVFDLKNLHLKKSVKRPRISEDDVAEEVCVEEHEHCQNIIKSLTEQLNTANSLVQELTNKNIILTKSLEKVFTHEQIKLLQKNNTNKGIKWSDQAIKNSLKLYLTCGTNGYEELRRQNYPLPTIRTLQRKIQYFKCMPEIHDQIFKLLEIKVDCLLPEERHAVLLVDEMAIKPGLQFDNCSGEIIGKPTLKNSSGNDADEYATHALVFMLAGITTRWKQTIGYHFTGRSYSATEANKIISEIIRKASLLKLDVCAVISDMGPQNRALWKLNNISASRHSKISNVTEYYLNENVKKEVYFLPDATHIYKNIRLALTEGNILYLSQDVVDKVGLPSNKISIEPIKIVVEEDKKKDIKVAPYLKEIHLHPKHFDKMNVQGAMAILNHDTAAAIKYYIIKDRINSEHLTTAWFLEIIHKWYNIMSSRIIKHGLSKHDVAEYKDTINFLEEFIKIIVNIRIGENGYWKPIQTGILLTTKTVIDLQEKFLNTYKFQYLLLSRFTQDALENLFSNIRSRNPVPTAKEFKTAMRLICISQYFTQPKHGNYGVTDDVSLADFFSPNEDRGDIINLEHFVPLETNSEVINDEEKEALYYLIGSILRNIQKNQLHCNDCISAVTLQNSDISDTLKIVVDLKSYRKDLLIYPSVAIFTIILEAEKMFRQHSNELIKGSLKLGELVNGFLNFEMVKQTQFPDCHNVLKRIVNLFFKNRVYLFLRKHRSEPTEFNTSARSSRSVGMRAVLNFN